MRIFEKISRRLAITLAGVMACSSFAMAPALIAHAEEQQQGTEGQTTPTNKDFQKDATQLTNDADYTSETDFIPEAVKVYKIKSDIDGKLRVFVKAKDATKVSVYAWKEDEESYIFEDKDKDVAAGKTYEGSKDIKEGTYYISIGVDKDVKLQVKADIITDKATKIRNAESPAKKTAKVTIKKAKKVDGYEVRFSTSKDFDKNVKTKSVKAKKIEFKDKKGTIEKSGLKSGKKYYVQVRTYVKENGVKYYSDWSKSKKIAKVK